MSHVPYPGCYCADCVERQAVAHLLEGDHPMKNTHIEGPWFVKTAPVLSVVGEEGQPVICEITAHSDREGSCDCELLDIAKLIAAAPALRRALTHISNEGGQAESRVAREALALLETKPDPKAYVWSEKFMTYVKAEDDCGESAADIQPMTNAERNGWRFGSDQGAGAWCVSPDEVTVSQYMLSRLRELAEKVERTRYTMTESGDDWEPDATIVLTEPNDLAREARKCFAVLSALLSKESGR